MDDVADKLDPGEHLTTPELPKCLPTLKEGSARLLGRCSAGVAVWRTPRAVDTVRGEGGIGFTAFYVASDLAEPKTAPTTL